MYSIIMRMYVYVNTKNYFKCSYAFIDLYEHNCRYAYLYEGMDLYKILIDLVEKTFLIYFSPISI